MKGATCLLCLLATTVGAYPKIGRQSEVTFHDFAAIDEEYRSDLPQVQHVSHEPTVMVDMLQMAETQAPPPSGAPAPLAAGQEDPWERYGGERSLFCRVQYYHDTVELSPQCELAEYDSVPELYHTDRYNCQFFEQRGIIYFYGEKWEDCTPMQQRGKKTVMECGVQCAPRSKTPGH